MGQKYTSARLRDKGATLNGKRLGVSKTAIITDSLLITGFAYDRAERADYYLARFKALDSVPLFTGWLPVSV